MKTKKILLVLVIFVLSLVMIGCTKKDECKILWEKYITAMNNKDFNAVAEMMFPRNTDKEKFLASVSEEEYFGDFVSASTVSFDKDVDCDFSNEARNEYYGRAKIKVALTNSSGTSEQDILVYFEWIYDLKLNINKLAFCSSVSDGNKEANLIKLSGDKLGNSPSTNWTNKAYYIQDSFVYKIVDNNKVKTVRLEQYIDNKKNVEIPSQIDGMDVTTIGSYAFYKKAGIINITISTSKTKSVVIPNTITTIEKNAFYQCRKIKELYIPSSVKTIAENAFTGCREIEKITLDVDDSAAYSKLLSVESELDPNSTVDIEIVGGRNMYIGDVISLSALVEESVEDKSIKWSTTSSAVTIDAKGNLKAVTAGTNVVVIATLIAGDNPYNCAKITFNVTSGASLLSLSSNTFDRCSGLKELYVNAINPKSITISGLGMKLPSTVKIYVPFGSGNMYKNEWASFADQIVEMEE